MAWREVLDDLVARGMKTPELGDDGRGKGLEATLAGVWNEVPGQRCTVHKERDLVAHAPKRMAEEIKKDFNERVYAESAAEFLAKRKTFLAKWRAPSTLSRGSTRSSSDASRPNVSCLRRRR